MLWVIIIVCAIFAFICQPLVDKTIKKHVSSKWVATLLQLVIYWIIFMALYGIAALLGFNVAD